MIPTEHEEQKAVVRWFDQQYRDLRGRLFAIPNGGERNAIVAAKLKAEGVRQGVPDLMLPVARQGHYGLWIEMKRTKGSSTSDEQKSWIAFLAAQGYRAEICKGADAARNAISNYLGG